MRSCQDCSNINLRQDLGKILARSCQVEILARSWQESYCQDLAKKNLDKILAGILPRFCQDKFLPRIFPRSWQEFKKIYLEIQLLFNSWQFNNCYSCIRPLKNSCQDSWQEFLPRFITDSCQDSCQDSWVCFNLFCKGYATSYISLLWAQTLHSTSKIWLMTSTYRVKVKYLKSFWIAKKYIYYQCQL